MDQPAKNCLTLKWARIICEMEAVCYSEGIGPANAEIMLYVASTYPELKAEFSWLPWDRYEEP